MCARLHKQREFQKEKRDSVKQSPSCSVPRPLVAILFERQQKITHKNYRMAEGWINIIFYSILLRSTVWRRVLKSDAEFHFATEKIIIDVQKLKVFALRCWESFFLAARIRIRPHSIFVILVFILFLFSLVKWSISMSMGWRKKTSEIKIKSLMWYAQSLSVSACAIQCCS